MESNDVGDLSSQAGPSKKQRRRGRRLVRTSENSTSKWSWMLLKGNKELQIDVRTNGHKSTGLFSLSGNDGILFLGSRPAQFLPQLVLIS